MDDADGDLDGYLLAVRADGSGLLYRRNRYNDPATGRLMQADKIGLAGGANLFGFAFGDHINVKNPSGDTIVLNGARQSEHAALQTICTSSAAWELCRQFRQSFLVLEFVFVDRSLGMQVGAIAEAWTYGQSCQAKETGKFRPDDATGNVSQHVSPADATSVIQRQYVARTVREDPSQSLAGIMYHEMLRHWAGLLSKGCKSSHPEGSSRIDGATTLSPLLPRWWSIDLAPKF